MADAYQINLTDPLSPAFQIRAFTSNGSVFPTSSNLALTATSASTSLLLYGKGHPNYGERTAEDLVHIMENFSGASVPANPISGQLWYARYTILQTATAWYLWTDDDDANSNGGTWSVFVPISQPAAPAVVNDGYWLDTLSASIFYGINDGQHPMSTIWLERVYDINTLVAIPPVTLQPRKQLLTYNGARWVKVSTQYSSSVALQDPDNGDLWINESTGHLNFYDNSAFVEVVNTSDLTTVLAPYLPLAGGTMTGDLDMANNDIFNVPTVTSGIFAPDNLKPANKIYVDTEIATQIGAIPPPVTALSDLTDVNPFAVPSSGHFLRGNGSEWANAVITVSDIPAISVTASDINQLAGISSNVQTQLTSKLNLTGGTLTGQLILAADPIGNFEAATKQYVDNNIGGGGTADGVLTTAGFTSGTMLLDLTTTAATNNVFSVDMTHAHVSTEVSHATTQPLLRDLLASYPTVGLSETLETVINDLNTRLSYYETFSTREVFTTAASQVIFSLTDGDFPAGTNKTSVYVAGNKQLADVRARQGIYFNTGQGVSASAPHGLADGTYYYRIAIDGGGLAEFFITVTNGTNTNTTVQAIINSFVNDAFGATTVWSKRDTAMHVFSDTSGVGSSIDIQDGVTLPALFASLDAAGTPIYTAGNIFPPAGGPITTGSNQDYKEMNGGTEARFGESVFTIQFNVAPTTGDAVEIIAEPSFFEMV